MSATQNGSQVSGAGSGSSSGNGDDGSKKIRKFEAVIILQLSLVAGLVTGIAARTMGHFPYFGAIVFGVGAGFALPGVIIMIIKYVRNQS
ncbi:MULTISPECIES: hypothetical protein [unclassified Streptomyces]|uniref:hypothetical protein n=1 Tax=unclassified Streptomyces TaxID=2593676 RepID=UPI002E2D7CC8|nr:hypothetical protein [Streptomyces sp. NBC_00228]